MARKRAGPPDPAWSLGPISIKRTTDVVALVAFVLSLIGLLAQVRDYLRGADVILFSPKQVTFGSSQTLGVYFKDQFLIVTAIMGYVNDAPTEFNAAVRQENIRFVVGGKKYQYVAHQSVSTSSETSELTVVKKDDSGPFAVNAGGAVSHEVLFEPHEVECANDDHDCVGALEALSWNDFKAAVKRDPNIKVMLVAEIYGKPTLIVPCTVTLNPNDLAAFDSPGPHQQWAAPNCREDKGESIFQRFIGAFENR